MFGYTDFSIDFLTGQPLMVGGALVALLALAGLLYFRTNPPLRLPIRIILGLLRIIAVFALIAALSEPVISFSRQIERKVRVSLLLDHSASMHHAEGEQTRLTRMDSLLSGEHFAQLSKSTDLSISYFGGNVAPKAAEVDPDRTALGDALRHREQAELAKPADHWLLLSDGNSNSGEDPITAARGFTVPITTVNLATDGGDFDVALSRIDVNPVLFVGETSELEVRLSWHQAAGRTVNIRLTDENRSVDEQPFAISQDDGFGVVQIRYTPTAPGQKLLRLECSPLDGEVSTANNSRTIAVQVLKSRIEVLLVTGAPDYEVGFLKRHLDRSERFRVTLTTLGDRLGNLATALPNSQGELNRYDLIVLHDPDPDDLASRAGLFQSFLSEKGGGIWLLMGGRLAATSQSWLDDLLPFSRAGNTLTATEVVGVPVEGQLFHPAVRLGDDRATIRETWAELPPFRSLVMCTTPNENSVILVTAMGAGIRSDALPLLGYRRFGPGKLLASTALPFWPWGFMNLGLGEDPIHYGRFLDGCLSWLSIQDDFDPIRIAPTSQIFSRGDPVLFEGFAYDQGYRPIPAVSGFVRLTDDQGNNFEADLIEREEGKFSAELTALPSGEYAYQAELSKEGALLKSVDGRIQVEAFSLEEFDQRGDAETLRALSRLTGAQAFTFDQFDDALATIDRRLVVETPTGEWVLWGRLWLLLLFVGALAMEWALRKFNHLV